MKKAITLTALLGVGLLCAGLAQAEERKIPTAPADFLAKTNPTKVEEADEDMLKAGGKIYAKKCAKCHGETGDGKGSAAAELVIKPTAFSVPGYLAGRKDGQLFWITLNGSTGTEMKGFGPGSEQNFTEEEIWQVTTYMRSAFTK